MAEHILAVTKSDDFHKRLEAEQKMLMGTCPSLEYIEGKERRGSERGRGG